MYPNEKIDRSSPRESKNDDIATDPLTWLLTAPLGSTKKACRQENDGNYGLDGSRCCFEDILNNGHYFTRFNGLECGNATLYSEKVSHTLAHFIACFIYSSWHGIPFSKVASSRKKSLSGFTAFVRDILKVTTLQLSVVLLSLKLVLHLKSLKPNLNGAEGSEFRLLVCTLMLAMKLLVDNTYTNFTWQKVSRIPLDQINTVEMEFLTQVDYRLYFSQEDFRSWLCYVRNSLIDFISHEISLGDSGCDECRKHEIFSNDELSSKFTRAKAPKSLVKQTIKDSNNYPGYHQLSPDDALLGSSTVASIIPKHSYKDLRTRTGSPMLIFPTPSSPTSSCG